MLKLNPNPTFSADVRITVPGEITPAVIKIEYRHMTVAAAAAWWEENKKKPRVDALAQIIASWEGVNDANDHPSVFSPITLGALLENYPAATAEIIQAYWRELTASKVKN